MKEFSFSDGIYTIDLLLRGKFSVLSGLSGAGKSFLLSFAVGVMKMRGPDVKIPILVYCGLDGVYRHIDDTDRCLILIDEEEAPDIIKEFMPRMLRSNHYFVFVSREGNNRIPYGVRDEYIMLRKGKHLRMAPKYKYTRLTRKIYSPTCVIVEDSCLGHWIVSEILGQFGITVISAKGKSRLADTLLQAPRNSLVVFDACGIARDFSRLLKVAERMGEHTFDSESLEWEIGHALFPSEFHDYEVPRDIAYASAEAYYISELTRLLGQYGIPYSKSNAELVPIFHEGKGVVHSRFCDLSSCPGTHIDIYKELRELDEIAR